MVIKYRKKVINDEISERLKEIFSYIQGNYNITLEEWNYDIDHVHILFRSHPNTNISKFINAYKSAGANGVIVAEPLVGLLSPALAEEFCAPYMKQIVDAVQDEEFLVIYHNCGDNVLRIVDSIVNCGAGGYHFGNAIRLADILPLIPPDRLLLGNVDPAVELCNGTPESVYTATRKVIEECGSAPNFCISSGCDIPPKAPWNNIDAFFAAATES